MATPIDVPEDVLREIIGKMIPVMHEPIRTQIIKEWTRNWSEIIRTFVTTLMGKANWVWDEELDMQIPCCSYAVEREIAYDLGSMYQATPCGDGPLTTLQEITAGRCQEHMNA